MGFSGRGAEIRLKSNTIQIQTDEHLGHHDIEMNEDETSEKFVRLTTGGTSATKARTSQMTPFRKGNTSAGQMNHGPWLAQNVITPVSRGLGAGHACHYRDGAAETGQRA